MDHSHIISELARNRAVFEQLLRNIAKDEYSWKPAQKKWSLLEIVCHLYDEEREDFRARVTHCLKTPEAPMPSIDPQGWVNSRKYMEQNYEGKLHDFLSERNHSVNWLQSLQNADWKSAYHHPKMGPISAEMMLANWLAHDYHHIRQINNNKHAWLQYNSGEDLKYAGDW
jgi:hypothetical protein